MVKQVIEAKELKVGDYFLYSNMTSGAFHKVIAITKINSKRIFFDTKIYAIARKGKVTIEPHREQIKGGYCVTFNNNRNLTTKVNLYTGLFLPAKYE